MVCQKKYKKSFYSTDGLDVKKRKNDWGARIGLLLVKEFLEKYGGGIWYESEVGLGSSFYFTLPITSSLSKIL